MVYTRKHPALLIMGVIFVAIAILAGSGAGDGIIGFLKVKKYVGEMVGMGYAFGAIGVGLCALGAITPVFLWPERIGVVGTYAQYRGGFGLVDYGGALLHGALAALGYVALGVAFLLLRIRWGQRNA